MANLTNKTRSGVISVYHECISPELAQEAAFIFEKYRKMGHDRDGVTGGGMDKRNKDTRDMNPKVQYRPGHEFYDIAHEIELNVMECLVDYYRDNPGMLYSYLPYGRIDRSTYPDPKAVIPQIFNLQYGQYQDYDKVSNGYSANHAEAVIQYGKPVESDYRTLTWMMTLNELPVTDEQYGYTVFTNQNIAVRPKAGQLCLFSPFIDCEHRGNPTNGVSKSIVTAWVTSRR